MHYFVREKKIKYWELKCVLKVLINENNELKKNLSDYIAYIDRLQGYFQQIQDDKVERERRKREQDQMKYQREKQQNELLMQREKKAANNERYQNMRNNKDMIGLRGKDSATTGNTRKQPPRQKSKHSSRKR